MGEATGASLSPSFDIIDFVIGKGNGVKGLSEMRLNCLPKQYIQPLANWIDAKEVTVDKSIPIIDMSNWDTNPDAANSVCDAAEKWGFFQVVNHGVPLEVLNNVMASTQRFFDLPGAEKSKYSKMKKMHYGTSFIPETEMTLEWKDYLSLVYLSADAALSWPSTCRNEVLEYLKQTATVIKKLLQALMKRLNVEHIDEDKEVLLMGSKRINLNYYPECPDPNLTFGISSHSDISTLTLLLQDDIGGLQVRGPEIDTWIRVPPVSGSLVINVGDALEIISNGRYKSVEHRVMASRYNNRISVPIFVNPHHFSILSPLPELLANGEKAVYKEVSYFDYIKYFFSKPHGGKSTIEFAKI